MSSSSDASSGLRSSPARYPTRGSRRGASTVPAVASRPQLDVSSMAEHLAAREAQASQLLAMANGLLTLTILVALTGVANTVALSLLERRNELALLRAVGMSRRQVRRMVRLEALTVSTCGAVAGTTVGVGTAVLAIRFLPDEFIGSTTVPAGSLTIYAALCVAFGVLAASVPARRASRLDVAGPVREV